MITTSNSIAESAVLSMMLREDHVRRSVFGDGITGEHFTADRRAVFEAVRELAKDGSPVDPATVWGRVQGRVDHTDAGQIEDLANYAPGSDNLTAWIKELRDSLALRIAQDAALGLAEAKDGQEASGMAQAALEAIKGVLRGPSKAKSAKEAGAAFIAYLEELYASGDLPGIATGIDDLDLLSGGMRPGELWNSLGQTSRGKSVLMLQIAAHAANAGRHVAIFSAEMMDNQVYTRLVSNLGLVRMDAITKPRTAGGKERDRMATTIKRIQDMRLWIDDSPGMTVEHIEAESQRIADAHGPLDLVVVDYLQFVKTRKERGESREQEVARISGNLKQLAKLLKCPVLTGSQLNKQNEARESARIEMDADCLLVICDDGIKVGKLRNGKRDDTIPYILNGVHQRFEKAKGNPLPF